MWQGVQKKKPCLEFEPAAGHQQGHTRHSTALKPRDRTQACRGSGTRSPCLLGLVPVGGRVFQFSQWSPRQAGQHRLAPVLRIGGSHVPKRHSLPHALTRARRGIPPLCVSSAERDYRDSGRKPERCRLVRTVSTGVCCGPPVSLNGSELHLNTVLPLTSASQRLFVCAPLCTSVLV